MGILTIIHKQRVIQFLTTNYNLLFAITIFIIIFISTTLGIEYLQTNPLGTTIIWKGLSLLITRIGILMYSILGIAISFGMTNYFLINRHYVVSKLVQNINPLCMGIYLFQQFVLQFLYYKTALPSAIGPIWLPIIGMILTIIISICLSALLRKVKIGRFLIG